MSEKIFVEIKKNDIAITIKTIAQTNVKVANVVLPTNIAHNLLQNLDYVHAGHTGFQDTLVSGINIKTIGGVSVLGNGDLPIVGSYYSKTFLISDWVNQVNVYYTQLITHDLNTLTPQTTIYNGTYLINVDNIEIIDANNIRIYTLYSPDGRFDGSIIMSI
jgi:hypothetical protein